MAVLQWYKITEEYIILRFGYIIDTSTLINDNFTLDQDDATPSSITDPFDTIVVDRDYQSVARELYLYWNIDLQNETDYTLTISNIKDVVGNVITDGATPQQISFTTGTNTATPTLSESDFTKTPNEIEDWSIKEVGELSTTSGVVDSGTFRIVSIYPDVSQSYYLGPYDYQGKIEITFSHFVPANFITSQDFKLQKKLLTDRTVVGWTDVSTAVAQDGANPIVSVYLPSTDATPIYSYQVEDLTDYEFWEEGYKYRLIISKNIGY